VQATVTLNIKLARKLAPEDFEQPLYVAALAMIEKRMWERVFRATGRPNPGEAIGQPRGQLIDGKALIAVRVPLTCVGCILFDRKEGGEELDRGYCDWFNVRPDDSIVFSVNI
jgi:hypothetical protein